MLDVSYNGEHGYNIPEPVNVNTVDLGTAFLAANQDPTVTSALPGGAAVSENKMRGYRGFGSVTKMIPRGFITSQTILSLGSPLYPRPQFDVNAPACFTAWPMPAPGCNMTSTAPGPTAPTRTRPTSCFRTTFPPAYLQGRFRVFDPIGEGRRGGCGHKCSTPNQRWQLLRHLGRQFRHRVHRGHAFQNGAGTRTSGLTRLRRERHC